MSLQNVLNPLHHVKKNVIVFEMKNCQYQMKNVMSYSCVTFRSDSAEGSEGG